jgi:hypothetical protein
MTALLARVRALIAQTSSPSEEEARTAAVQACRLIRENDLLVTYTPQRAAADGVPTPKAPPPPPDSETVPSSPKPDRVAAWASRRDRRGQGKKDIAKVIGKAAGEVLESALESAIRK